MCCVVRQLLQEEEADIDIPKTGFPISLVRRHFVPLHFVPGHILSRDNMSRLKSVLKVVVGVHRRDILSRWCSSRGDILSRYQLFGNKWYRLAQYIAGQNTPNCGFNVAPDKAIVHQAKERERVITTWLHILQPIFNDSSTCQIFIVFHFKERSDSFQ